MARRLSQLAHLPVTELKGVFADLREERSTRAVVLTGTGRGFCAGANLAGDDELPPRARDRGPVGLVQMMQEHLAELMLAIHELPQPVVAAVHGAAVGGGLALALAADLRVASDDAFFISIESWDPRFDPSATGKLLESLGARSVELVES